MKVNERISIYTAEKSALKLGNLLSVYLSLKVHKVAKFYRRLYGGGHELAPH